MMAEQNEASFLSEKDVQCGVCQELVIDKQPKLLNCLHFFCKKCIEKKVCRAANQMISCPTCKEETFVKDNDVDDLPTAYFIERMYKAAPQTTPRAKKPCIKCNQCVQPTPNWPSRYCTECKYMCNKCYKKHMEWRGFSGHTVFKIDDLNEHGIVPARKPKCKIHGKKLEYYCCTCEQVACHDCFSIGKHKGHKQRVPEGFETLEEQLELLRTTDIKWRQGIQDIESSKNTIDSNVQNSRKEIDRVIDEAKMVVERRKIELIHQLDSVAKEMKDPLDVQLKELQDWQIETDRVTKLVQICLKSEDAICIAECNKVMVNKISSLKQESDLKCTTPVTPANIHAEIDSDFSQSLGDLLKEKAIIRGSQADVSKSRIENCIESTEVGRAVTLQLHTVYENEQPCVTQQNVHAELHTHNNGTLTTNITRTGKGIYQISFTPMVRGRHELCVTVNNKKLSSSPYKLSVYMPPYLLKPEQNNLRLNQPYQSAFTPDGDHLVLDKGQVFRVKQDCKKKFYTPNSDHAVPHNAQGIATAPDGSVYVVYDGATVRIVKYDKDGTFVTDYNDDTQDRGRPRRIKYNHKNNLLYICDRKNGCFQVFDSDLKHQGQFASGHYNDITFDSAGNIYLSCRVNNLIYKFPHGQFSISSQCFGQDHLKGPRGLLYLNGHLYVADNNNKRVAVFKIEDDEQTYVTSFTHSNFFDLGSITADLDGYIHLCDEKGYMFTL